MSAYRSCSACLSVCRRGSLLPTFTSPCVALLAESSAQGARRYSNVTSDPLHRYGSTSRSIPSSLARPLHSTSRRSAEGKSERGKKEKLDMANFPPERIRLVSTIAFFVILCAQSTDCIKEPLHHRSHRPWQIHPSRQTPANDRHGPCLFLSSIPRQAQS